MHKWYSFYMSNKIFYFQRIKKEIPSLPRQKKATKCDYIQRWLVLSGIVGAFTTTWNATRKQGLSNTKLQQNKNNKAITNRHHKQNHQILPLRVAVNRYIVYVLEGLITW